MSKKPHDESRLSSSSSTQNQNPSSSSSSLTDSTTTMILTSSKWDSFNPHQQQQDQGLSPFFSPQIDTIDGQLFSTQPLVEEEEEELDDFDIFFRKKTRV